ncbi:aBC transporter [Clostridium sp. CAG:710]|jgi:sufB/sufD domain protein|nr:aBC transporter [Clostridium sp. CAG:710]
MNKLLVNSEEEINNLVIEEDTELVLNFNDTSRDIYIVVEDNICLNIVDISFNTSNKINITLKNDSRVIYNKFSINSGDYIYTLLDGEYSNVVINNSVVNNDDTKMKFVIEHNNTNTSSNLSNHGVNNSSGTLYFNVDSKINRSASLACADQENKIINLVKGDSKILPNLLVDNYDVSASHSAYISDFDKESMFYLKSRGISDNEARRLLLEGFLIGNLDVDDETKKNLLSYIKI